MECFLRETELLAAARFRSCLVRAADYLAPAVSDDDEFAPGLTGFFEVSSRGPRLPPPNKSGKLEAATGLLKLC
jgi:hypothetical protein